MEEISAKYQHAMRYGHDQYRDVIDHLTASGLPAEFTQTGGMCAALHVALPDGRYLLICDAEDTLSWEREEHSGWSVGLYPPDDSVPDEEWTGEPSAFVTDPDGSLGALLPLIRRVLPDSED